MTAIAAAALCCGVPTVARAAVVFSNGFETGDFDGWDYELNEEGLSVVTAPEPVLAGTYSLRCELTSEREWDNGIFRTEVQHKPEEARAADGTELFFGWSVYLPKALPEGDYQLGYFETRETYQQVFSLHVEGSDLALYINTGSPASPSQHPGLMEVGKWHRIVYHVKWSSDKAVGFVSLWWDGVKLVHELHGKTYLGDPALVQLGLLKDPPEPPEPIVLYVDEVMEGDSYADVGLGIPEVGGPSPVPSATDGVGSTSLPPATTTVTAPAPVTPPTAAPTAAPVADTTNESEGGCALPARRARPVGAWGIGFALLALRLRRFRQVRLGKH